MYLVAVYYNGEFKDFVQWINYKHGGWQSGGKPKVYKNFETALKCRDQVDEWASAAEVKILELKEVIK